MRDTVLWAALGFLGQALFASRFLVQWIASERRHASVVPVFFWYASIAGGAILLTYAIYRKDPVFIVGQATGIVVYARNLVLLKRSAGAAGAVTSSSPGSPR
jgi:lipid-A-disaccharide synthase-like uncharacterized protein